MEAFDRLYSFLTCNLGKLVLAALVIGTALGMVLASLRSGWGWTSTLNPW